jgi:predicted CoA-binding protein
VDPKQKYIAVVGVSAQPNKFGHKIFKDLLGGGYDIDGVNLKGKPLFGRNVYKNLSKLPRKPDLVLLVIPPEQTEIVVDECVRLGIKEIWMQPGAQSQNAIEKAKKAQISVTSNSCFMVANKIW